MDTILTLTLNPAVDVAIEVEELAPQCKLRSPYARYEPGGGGINVARGIHRCGGQVHALFTIGGAMGALLAQLVAREHVPHTAIPIRGNTRESINVLVRQPKHLYRFVLPGPALEPGEAERCLAALAAQQPGARYWIVSGSLPEGVDASLYGRLARMARDRDVRLIVDTSGPALAAAVDEGVYLIKPNRREFAELVGYKAASEEELREQSRELVSRKRVEVVVVSLAEQGALLTTAGEQYLACSPRVQLVSSVGAGDSFVALLSLKLAAGCRPKEALAYAVAAGAAAVTTPGTELFHPGDVDRFYPQVQIQS